jgi:predicted transcriptional regulator YheO
MKKKPNKLLLRELQTIAQGLGKTFAPFCEVVVHDLSHPKHAIFAIENNLSGRRIGQPVTELGLARIGDPDRTSSPTAARSRALRSASRTRVASTSPRCA